MQSKKFTNSVFFRTVFLLTTVSIISSTAAATHNGSQIQNNIVDDEDTHIFAGRCPNGQPYRLFSYQVQVNGQTHSLYDYQGPAGRGTVKTQAAPKTLATRVCRPMAEIAND
jgi:hypothetical protein